jgi:hypothetical protein
MRYWTWALAAALAGVTVTPLLFFSLSLVLLSFLAVAAMSSRHLVVQQHWHSLADQRCMTRNCCPLLLCHSCRAAGGVFVHAQTGCASAVHLGVGSGAVLGMAAVAMSDMRGGNPVGELGVKAAFGEWAAV